MDKNALKIENLLSEKTQTSKLLHSTRNKYYRAINDNLAKTHIQQLRSKIHALMKRKKRIALILFRLKNDN